jgi:hypothetical protein
MIATEPFPEEVELICRARPDLSRDAVRADLGALAAIENPLPIPSNPDLRALAAVREVGRRLLRESSAASIASSPSTPRSGSRRVGALGRESRWGLGDPRPAPLSSTKGP